MSLLSWRAHPERVELAAELRDLLVRIHATAKGAEMAAMARASPVRQASSGIIARISDFEIWGLRLQRS
jgi:hypothetical protein